MENFSYGSYPDSGDSSPRSREIEYDNPPPWEDHHLPQNYKQAKFMCSYGGKILPRPHDNHLCYVGGETKILAVDRSIKFPAMIAKLSALYGGDDVSFKYQLPGEDLDSLISVTSDDDLEHMMHEYDRLYRTSAKPARMRLFLIQTPVNLRGSFGSDGSRPDPDMFVEALNSAPLMGPDHVTKPPVVTNKAEFLFGLEKVVAPPPLPLPPSPPPPLPTTFPPVVPLVSHAVNPIETVVGGYTGDYYAPKVAPGKIPATLATVPPAVSAPAGYWPEKQVSSCGFSTLVTTLPITQEQPVYVIPASSGGGAVFHQPVGRPVTGPTPPAYGHMPQRVAPEVYREPPMYNIIQQPPPLQLPLSGTPLSTAPPHMTTVPLPNILPPSAAPPNTNIPPISAALHNVPPQAAKIAAAATYSEGVGIMRHSGGFGAAAAETARYAPVAYDSATGRQVYYTAAGTVVVAPTVPQTFPPLTAALAVGSDGRPGGGLGLEGNVVVGKISQTSV